MPKIWNNSVLRVFMDAAGGDGGGTGGGTGLLTPPASGGGTPPASGSPPPASGAGVTPPAGNAGTTPPTAGGEGSTDWKSVLSKELQEDASLKKFTSVAALAGGYVSAQKLIGADKIAVPGKHTTPEEFRQVLNKLGLPEDQTKYAVAFKKEAQVDEDFTKKFTEQAFKTGMLPQHAQAMADWMSDMRLETVKQFDAARGTRQKETTTALEKEWGNAFQQKLSRANQALMDAGGKEAFEYFHGIGLSSDVKFIKMLSAMGDKMYGEHTIIDNNKGGPPARTPQELDSAIAQLKASPAFLDKGHPQHKTLVAEYTALFQERYPTKSS